MRLENSKVFSWQALAKGHRRYTVLTHDESYGAFAQASKRR